MEFYKNILIVFLFIVMIIGSVIHINISEEKEDILNSDSYKIEKGHELFQNDVCIKTNSATDLFYQDSEHKKTSLTIVTPWKCLICDKTARASTAPAPKLCDECSSITNRCSECGKLLNLD